MDVIESNKCKVFGDIPGIPVGMHFMDRRDLCKAGVHGRGRWGIHGNREEGAYSIVLNGGYDDKDRGETIIYTGHGKGRDKYGKSGLDKGPQVGDQRWHLGNYALKESARTKYPVRVIRGPDAGGDCAPAEGYRYDGLYDVVRAWQEKGKDGFLMCRFELHRTTSFLQDPLPSPDSPIKIWWHRRKDIPRSFSSRSQSEASTSLSSQLPSGPPTAPCRAILPDTTLERRKYTPEERQLKTGFLKYGNLGPIPKFKSSGSTPEGSGGTRNPDTSSFPQHFFSMHL